MCLKAIKSYGFSAGKIFIEMRKLKIFPSKTTNLMMQIIIKNQQVVMEICRRENVYLHFRKFNYLIED